MRKLSSVSSFLAILLLISLLCISGSVLAADLLMGKGESRVLPVQHLDRVAVAEPDIADVLVIGDTELLVTAKALGTTTLHIWEKSGRASYSIRVVTNKKDLASELQELIGISGVAVRIIEDAVLVDGAVSSEEERQRAIRAAGAYGDRVIDLTILRGQEQMPLAERVEAVIGNERVGVQELNGTLVLEGVVPDSRQLKRAETLASIFSQKVVSFLEVEEPLEATESRDEGPEATSVAEFVTALNEPEVEVTEVSDTLILEGTVQTEFRRKRALALAGASGKKIIDLLTVLESEAFASTPAASKPESGIEDVDGAQRLSDIIGLETVSLRRISGVLFIEGTVPTELEKNRVEAVVEAAGFEYRSFLVVEQAAEAKQPVNSSMDSVLAQVRQAVNDPRIEVYAINQILFLEGLVGSQYDKNRAEKLVSAFLPPERFISLIQVEAAKEQVGGVATAQDPSAETGAGGTAVGLDSSELVAEKIQRTIPYEGVGVTVVEGSVVLTGEVSREDYVEKAERLASIFKLPVVNLLTVRPVVESKPAKAQQIKDLMALENVRVVEIDSRILLEGAVKTQLEKDRAQRVAELFTADVVNMIRVTEPQQVLLQVTALEANRSATNKLGITWGSLAPVFTPHEAVVGQTQVLGPVEFLSRLGGKLEILSNSGDARILANPSMLALSGHEASFLAGGEIPVVIPEEDKIIVQWKEYGVKLNVTPVVDTAGQITVTVKPEVSTLDWANAVRVNAAAVPAMKTRRTSTTVQLTDGGTLALGGLIQSSDSKQVDKVPLLGDLPIIGKLFSSEEFKREETELIFLITAKIVSGPADQVRVLELRRVDKSKQIESELVKEALDERGPEVEREDSNSDR